MSRKVVLISVGALLAVTGAAVAIAKVGDRHGHSGPRWMDHGDGDHGSSRGRGQHHGAADDDDALGLGGSQGRRGFWGRGSRSMTADEFDARTRERFARLDKNSDGVIERTEIEGAIAERSERWRGRLGNPAQRMIGRFDTDKDGKVTKAEAEAWVAKRFARMDLDSDGKITDADLPPVMRGQGVLKGEGGALTRGFGRGAGGRGGGGFVMGRLIGADADKNGEITLQEVQTEAATRFTRMDRDKDGTIAQADFDALRKEMADYRVQRVLHQFGAKDGKVTREQFTRVAKERFAQRDLNSDGRIDRSDRRGRQGGPGVGRGPDGRGGMRGPDTSPAVPSGPSGPR